MSLWASGVAKCTPPLDSANNLFTAANVWIRSLVRLTRHMCFIIILDILIFTSRTVCHVRTWTVTPVEVKIGPCRSLLGILHICRLDVAVGTRALFLFFLWRRTEAEVLRTSVQYVVVSFKLRILETWDIMGWGPVKGVRSPCHRRF